MGLLSKQKRSYSPSIDDIRQHTLKRQRILDGLSSLSLSSPEFSSSNANNIDIDIPDTQNNVEYIHSIEDYLLHNQDDNDILETSRHLLDPTETHKLVIPASFTKIPKLNQQDELLSYDRVKSRKNFNRRYTNSQYSNTNVSRDEILQDYDILKNWSLIKYIGDPASIVFNKWELWYFNVYKLSQLSNELNNDNRIEYLPDDYDGKIDLTNDLINGQDNNDLMIDDYDDNKGPGIDNNYAYRDAASIANHRYNNYGTYYANSANSSFEAKADSDEMDLD